MVLSNGDFPRGLDPVFNLSGTFEDQVEQIIHLMRMPRDHVERVADLERDLKPVLKEEWPECHLAHFGSTPSGLAIVGSDIDYKVVIPNVRTTPNDNVLIGVKLLQKYPDLFENLSTIINVKVPALSFIHKPTGLSCDLIFDDFASIKETQLVKYLLTLDHRMYPLVMIIKIWAKAHGISASRGMSNIAWVLLIIFYSQQMNILPTIISLQKRCDEMELVENWNVAYKESFVDLYTSKNSISLYKLLGGFFDYYANFDFENFVISTYTATAMQRDSFSNIEAVPEEFKQYKFNVINKITEPLSMKTVFCMPHPFVHSKDAGVFVSRPDATKIINYFKKATNIFKTVNENDFLGELMKHFENE